MRQIAECRQSSLDKINNTVQQFGCGRQFSTTDEFEQMLAVGFASPSSRNSHALGRVGVAFLSSHGRRSILSGSV
jgi:hypothetical protein